MTQEHGLDEWWNPFHEAILAGSWEDIYAAALTLYRRGLCEGITRYAVHKDGQLLVGVMQHPLKDILQKARQEGPDDAKFA